MRFRHKYKKGDIRILRRFAWLPVYLGSEGNPTETLWLEHYYVEQKYEAWINMSYWYTIKRYK